LISSGWTYLIEGLLEAVLLVDAVNLRLLAANQAAADLIGMSPSELVGKPVIELTASPEDIYFWKDVEAGLADRIHSDSFMRCADGGVIRVERRVSRVLSGDSRPVYVVGLRDLSAQRQVEDELETLVAELSATLDSSTDGILVSNLFGQIRNYNRHFAQLWDVPQELLVNRNDKALYAHLASRMANPAGYARRLLEIAAQPVGETLDVLVLRSGRMIERVTVPQYSRGRLTGRVYSYRDITLQLQAESSMRLAAKVFESSPDPIFVTGPDFRIQAVNAACERLTGCSQAQLLGTSSKDLFQDSGDAIFFSRLEQQLASHGFWQGEIWRTSDSRASCSVDVSWVLLRDEQGGVTHTIGFLKDMTEKLQAQKRIEELAYSDALTGVPNRLLLSQRVEYALSLAERTGGQFSILFLDLDRFKNINDSMGHAFGDRVLVEVAERIHECLRDADTLCRLGGDEFVICLQVADAHGAEVAAQRLLDALARPFQIEEMSFSVGCSIGVAMYPQDGKTLDELIKYADTAMYGVKDSGRGSFRFYRPQMNVDILSRVKMDHALRHAIERGGFKLHYQPQISMASGQMIAAEALIRWEDPELGNVSPAVFIPLAEESGLIITIGNWVLNEAVRQAAIWQKRGDPVVLSINVSAMQFQQADFAERIASVLRNEGLDPKLLELELTESILVNDAHEALGRLHALAALGVGLSIDDFGTGYSSLAYLKKFPISKLKIDRSFIMGLPDDEGDRAIVSATIGMARALKLKVVAEGVETLEQRNCLEQFHCDAFQGFLCSPGLDADAFEALMQTLPRPPATEEATNIFAYHPERRKNQAIFEVRL
jgi:diguanylate cyclase (GGDEF)-like protein/PAS domain S-box-containing protein